jgi:hypothetical protein
VPACHARADATVECLINGPRKYTRLDRRRETPDAVFLLLMSGGASILTR